METLPTILTDLKFEEVKRVYSGKPGCMCGCRGIYRYPSTVDRDQEAKSQGYAFDAREINDSFVRKVVAELNENGGRYHVEGDDVWVEYEYENRLYVAYLKAAR